MTDGETGRHATRGDYRHAEPGWLASRNAHHLQERPHPVLAAIRRHRPDPKLLRLRLSAAHLRASASSANERML